jgi:hypothetical protein
MVAGFSYVEGDVLRIIDDCMTSVNAIQRS